MCVAPEMWIYDKANHNSLQPKPTKPTNPPNFPLDIQSLPPLTQREMSRRMGISLGKLNYCLTELARIQRFQQEDEVCLCADAPWTVYSPVTEGAEPYLSEESDSSLVSCHSYLVTLFCPAVKDCEELIRILTAIVKTAQAGE